MNYQIVYLDRYGNAEKLAGEAARCLPAGNTQIINLSQRGIEEGADVYLVGFEADQKAVPYEVIEAMDRMAGKTVLLFLTAGVASEESRGAIGRSVLPFLPDGCDFRGMFLCQGRLPDSMLDAMEEAVARNPDSRQARELLNSYRRAKGHPDAGDFAALRRFLQEKLGPGPHVSAEA